MNLRIACMSVWLAALASMAGAQSFKTPTLLDRALMTLPRGNMTEIVPGQILVKFSQRTADSVEGSALMQMRADSLVHAEAKFLNRIADSGWVLFSIPEDVDSRWLARELRLRPGVITAQPVNKIYPLQLAPPNDPDWDIIETSENLIFNTGEDDHSFRRLWYLDDINAWDGWTVWPNRWFTFQTKSRLAPLIAIIDTGVDMDHPDFANAGRMNTDVVHGGQLSKPLSKQFRFGEVDPAGTPNDIHGHGTHVAGLALAAGNNGGLNGMGMIGSGYAARGMILRVFDSQGQGTDADAAAAIYYAADNKADVINLSLGTENYSQIFQDAVTHAFERGSLVIAAGNEDGQGGGDLGPIYPAACSGALAVTANGPDKIPATTNYTGYGRYMSLAAPGGDVVIGSDFSWFKIQYDYSTAPRYSNTLSEMGLSPEFTYDYAYLVGTSMASPLVAGAAGMWYGRWGVQQNTGYANIRAYQALQRSAESVMGAPNGGWEPYQGYGSLDMGALMRNEDARGALVGSIMGIVYANATPLANVAVKAQRAGSAVVFTTTTLADGTYRYDALPPGTYTVTAAPLGLTKTRRVVVRAGCDFPNFNLWCGPVTGDDTPPQVVRAGPWFAVRESAMNVRHWGYDTQTGIDRITFEIGTTRGGRDVMAPREMVQDGNMSSPVGGGFRLQMGITYWGRVTWFNGAGLSRTVDFQFQRTS